MREKRYGKWAGCPNGRAYDPKRCAEEVQESIRGGLFHQCARKPGYGPDGLFCRQHDPAEVKRRSDESARLDKERRDRERPRWYGPSMLKIIRQIAEGHNDPTALCRAFIKQYDGDPGT